MRSIRDSIAVLLLAATALLTTGCGMNAGGLTLTSLQNKQAYKQTFSNAYASRNDAGDLDIVLVDNATQQALQGNAPDAPVRQIMHVRVLWKPTRDLKADDVAASNATLRWYVIGCDKTAPNKAGNAPAHPSQCGLIEYAGTAWVSTTTIESFMRVSIDNAVLKPVMNNGLQDPVGPSKVEGAVIARTNREVVNQLLAEVQTHTAVATAKP